MMNIRKAMSSEKGFTLVELLVVIGIIGILAMMLLPQFRGMRDRARIASCESNLKNIATQLESFYADQERYPAAADWTALVVDATATTPAGALNKLAFCPQDESPYVYFADIAPIVPAAAGTVDPMPTDNGANTTRIDSYVVFCDFHDGTGVVTSSVNTATTDSEAAKTQLYVTQDGVIRKQLP